MIISRLQSRIQPRSTIAEYIACRSLGLVETPVVNMFVGCGILLVLSFLTCAKLTLNGGLAIDASRLLVLTDFSFINTAYLRVLHQVLIKGIAVLGYVLQYRERIAAVGSAILAEISRLKKRKLLLSRGIFLKASNLLDRHDIALRVQIRSENGLNKEFITRHVIRCSEGREIGAVFVTLASAGPSIC
jgi:hypothetical protein